MERIEQIEYYAECPSCGAARTGNRETCDYCGAYLIKSRSFREYTERNTEEIFLQEDAGLAVEKGKLDSNKALMYFWLLFGGIFFLVPTFLCVVFCLADIMQGWVIGMLCIFWVIGLVSLSIPVRNFSRKRKCKRHGNPISGIVRGYEKGSFMVNDSSVLNLRVRIDTEDGKTLAEPYLLILGTGQTDRRYAIGSRVELKKYQKYYMMPPARRRGK